MQLLAYVLGEKVLIPTSTAKDSNELVQIFFCKKKQMFCKSVAVHLEVQFASTSVCV